MRVVGTGEEEKVWYEILKVGKVNYSVWFGC